MNKPTLQEYIRPVLTVFEDQQTHSYESVFRILGEQFDLIRRDNPRRITLMVNSALGYLKRAQVLELTAKQEYAITQRGMDLLRTGPNPISIAELRKYPEFNEFIAGRARRTPQPESAIPIATMAVPEDAIDEAYRQYNADLADRLLSRIKACSWQFFEALVKDLLVAMGYGEPFEEEPMTMGPGDEGIDGVIKADHLGLDIICIQAKKWEQSVGRPEVQKFAGSLESRRARKGVFITTSSYSAEAQNHVLKIEKRIVLVDGPKLAELMIAHGVGVSDSNTYKLRIIDSDYFGESGN